jgi:hypothetical protein
VNPAIYSSSVIEPDEGKDSMAQIISDLTRAAVLSMDLQTAIVSIYTKSQPDFLSRVAGVPDRIKSACDDRDSCAGRLSSRVS